MRRSLELIVIALVCVIACGILYVLYEDDHNFSATKSGKTVASRGVVSRASNSQGVSFSDSWAPVGMNSGRATSRATSRGAGVSAARTRSSYSGGSSYSPVSSSLTSGSNQAVRSGFNGTGGGITLRRPTSAVSAPVLSYGGGARANLSVQGGATSASGVGMPSYLAVNLNGSLRQTGGQASTTTMLGSSAVSASSYANQAPVMSVYGNPARSGARRRVGPPVVGGGGTNDSGEGVSGSWLNWLDKHYDSDTDFNNVSARAAYDEMIANWNPKMGPAPSYSDWLAWLQNGGSYGYTINDKTFRFPIGDIVPLILMALMYMMVMFVRKRKLAK